MTIGTRTISTLAAAWMALGPAACDTAEPDDGETMDMLEDGGDPMGDRDLEWQNRGDVDVEGTQHMGVAEVDSMTDDHGRVTSERLCLGAIGDRVFDAWIRPVGFDADDQRAIAFALFMREGPDEPWESFSIPGTVGDFTIEARTFRSVRINPDFRLMEVEVLLPSPDGMWSDHFVERIEISETTEIAVAPTPLASWDELEGTWEFGLAVACDDGPCQ